MSWGFETVTSLQGGREALRRRRFGVIEVRDERWVGVHLRPFPKSVSRFGIWLWGWRQHDHIPGNRLWLYYDQPWGCSGYLALKYVVSTRETTYRTLRRSLAVLDEIARIKQSLAIVCEVGNLRISDRLLQRWGAERHVLDSPQRHFIKRFYGQFPPALDLDNRLGAAPATDLATAPHPCYDPAACH